MTNAVKDQLWRLVNSLTKAEKRNFKLYAKRADANSNAKFIQLFDAMDRLAEPDDAALLDRLPVKNAGQLSNLKRHLYGEIMTSLRLLYISKEIDIEIRQQIDYARILYGKGLYLDALRILERIKQKAVDHSQDLLHLEILEFQKMIEARHVTRSRQVKDKMDLLINESARRSYISLQAAEMVNVYIQIHGYYIDHGHCRTEADFNRLDTFWLTIQPERYWQAGLEETFFEKVNRLHANMWYHYIRTDFEQAEEQARAAVNFFALELRNSVMDPDLYLRSRYYLGVMAFLNRDEGLLRHTLEQLDSFSRRSFDEFNDNTKGIFTTYRELTAFNLKVLQQDWWSAKRQAQQWERAIYKRTLSLAPHRRLLFAYKHAAVDFALGRYEDALDHLNFIVDSKSNLQSEELQIATRLLHLLCHFELGNLSLVDYHLTNVKRLLRKSRSSTPSQHAIVAGLRKLLRATADEYDGIYQQLQSELAEYQSLPYEIKATTYLDLKGWVDRKTDGESNVT